MGIRIHKVMGWGLNDVEHDKYRINDPRINRGSDLLEYGAKTDDYLEWVEAKYEKIDGGNFSSNMDRYLRRDFKEGIESGKYRFDLNNCVHYVAEYGLPNVIVIKPLSAMDWYRFDDSIDYTEETYLKAEGETQLNRCDVLEHAPYPYNGFYMDDRTGERIENGIRWVQYNWAELGPETRDTLARSFGFEDAEMIDRHFAPWVPKDVRDIAEYGELFTSEGVWRQLRPMLYVYWS